MGTTLKNRRGVFSSVVFLLVITYFVILNTRTYFIIRKTPVILFYEPHPERWFEPFNISERCNMECVFTYNRSLFNESEVVIFFRTLTEKLPAKPLGQKWIYLTFEPPIRQIGFNEQWENAFDWLMSYDKKAEVYVPFGRLKTRPADVKQNLNYSEIYSRKNKEVIWLVSHCSTHSKREEYVKELKKYINVDIFGGCANKTCPDGSVKGLNHFQALYNCKTYLSKQYKFYLSFEQALCDDYISEKLFGIYESNNYMIPVVRGDPNASLSLPKNTYISTFDFPSVKELADYLKYKGSSERRYTSLLKTKLQYEVIDWTENYKTSICELCSKLRSNGPGYRGQEFNLRNRLTRDTCYKPSDIK